MEDNYKKYADLLLSRCLCLSKRVRPLLITAPVESIDLVRILAKTAYELGVTDIHFDWTDETLKHEQLMNLDGEELLRSPFWNKAVYDEYAKKDAAFLMLYSDDIELMKDVSPEKIAITSAQNRKSRPLFKEKQKIDEVPWCIALAPHEAYANKVFAHSSDPLAAAWDAVFKVCLIYEDDPIEAWNRKVEINQSRCDKLNDLRFKCLHFTNGLGTNLRVELPSKHIWQGAGKENDDGLPLIVNMPTEEVFTTPDRLGVNGIVYSSKPLVYGGSLIENFSFRVIDGKVVEVNAKQGKEILEKMIEMDESASFFGEVALVDYDSPISNTNILFYETLFDENASCHFAVGSGFPNCYEGGSKMSEAELMHAGINQSVSHTDFMIGTADLKIVGTTHSGEELIVFENGNFAL